MSSHDWANYMDKVPDKFLETYVPDEYKAFIDICKKDPDDFEQIAYYLSYEPAEVSEIVNETFNKLSDAFFKKSGLSLSMREIDNDVDTAPGIEEGAHFILMEDMYVIRPEVVALNKLGADISHWPYVSWG